MEWEWVNEKKKTLSQNEKLGSWKTRFMNEKKNLEPLHILPLSWGGPSPDHSPPLSSQALNKAEAKVPGFHMSHLWFPHPLPLPATLLGEPSTPGWFVIHLGIQKPSEWGTERVLLVGLSCSASCLTLSSWGTIPGTQLCWTRRGCSGGGCSGFSCHATAPLCHVGVLPIPGWWVTNLVFYFNPSASGLLPFKWTVVPLSTMRCGLAVYHELWPLHGSGRESVSTWLTDT